MIDETTECKTPCIVDATTINQNIYYIIEFFNASIYLAIPTEIFCVIVCEHQRGRRVLLFYILSARMNNRLAYVVYCFFCHNLQKVGGFSVSKDHYDGTIANKVNQLE